MAKVEGQDGKIIGKCCPVFDYTEKKIVILFAKYEREEGEIRHVPSGYDKTQIPSFTSTQLVFFDEVHVKQFCGPPSTTPSNDKICLCESVGKLKGIGPI